jgi:phage terminase large subunit-like protein
LSSATAVSVSVGRTGYSLEAFEEFCGTLTLDTGGRMRLEPFQKLFLAEHFGGASEVVILLPKKNLKTTTLAALALFHLRMVSDAEVIVVASSRDQARILFKQAAGLVKRSGLEEVFSVKPGFGEIRLKEDGIHTIGARIRVLASDANTADGALPTLALVDELHRHKSAELYGVLRDGLGPRQGQVITISTAGATVESPLGHLRGRAQLLPSYRREGCYSSASSPDGAFVMHEWSLGEEDDPRDLEAVKQANPAPHHTLESLGKRLESPSTTFSQWARFACGLWMDDEEPYLSAEEWDACSEPLPDLDGRDCFAGLDLSVSTESTAFVLVFPLAEGKFAVVPQVFLPEEGLVRRSAVDRAPYAEWVRSGLLSVTPGNVVDYAFIKQAILDAGKTYRLREVGYARWNASYLVSELQDAGLSMVPVGQSYRDSSGAMQELRRLVLERKLIHGGHPILRRHILGMAVQSDPAGNVKPAKQRSQGRIDAASALIMGLGIAARAPQARPSAYAGRMCDCGDAALGPHFRTYHRSA